MIISYKAELGPNNKQISLFYKYCGTARFAYNWALNKQIDAHKNNEKFMSSIDLHKEFVKLKKTEFVWATEISKWVPQEAFRNLCKAYDNFFKNLKNKKIKNKGFPKFKSKKNRNGSFTVCEPIHIFRNSIQLPKLGIIRLKESDYIPLHGRIINATVSQRANKWFVSVTMEQPDKVFEGKKDETIGVDLGIKELATCSDGTIFKNPRILKNKLKKLKILQKMIEKKIEGGENREKARRRLAKLYYKISCIRTDNIHKITTRLTKTKSCVVIENLAISNLMKNHKLAQAISDTGWCEFCKQLKYKGKKFNCNIIVADRFYPSSKMCSQCGNIKKDLKLSDRIYCCEVCGLEIDRDLNAAINLKKFSTVGFTGFKACGERDRYLDTSESKQVASMKQEATIGFDIQRSIAKQADQNIF